MGPAHRHERGPILVIGLGNEFRGDDAAGIEVARQLAGRIRAQVDIDVIEEQGEPLRLLEAWHGYRTAIVIDALRAGAEPGAVHRMDMSNSSAPMPVDRCASTHAVSLSDTIELARSLGSMPAELIVYGLEGSCFTLGARISEPVRTAIARTSADVLHELGVRQLPARAPAR